MARNEVHDGNDVAPCCDGCRQMIEREPHRAKQIIGECQDVLVFNGPIGQIIGWD